MLACIAYTVMTGSLARDTWYVFLGGRSSGPQLLPVPTPNLTIAAWVAVVAAIVICIVVLFVKGPAADWLLVILILVTVGVAVGTAVLLTTAIPQLGLDPMMPRSTAESTLLGPAQVVGGYIAVPIVLGTLLGLPYLVGHRALTSTKRSHGRRAPARSR